MVLILDVLFTILLNALPIIILFVPLLFIWKKTLGKVYFRIFIGILVFYLIYWIFPIIFQIGVKPTELAVEEKNEGNVVLGIGYLAAHIGSLIILFSLYPLVTLPFIFFVAPFLALLFSWNRLRGEEGTIKENLKYITFEYNESPAEKIKKELTTSNWSREKEILKLMIVLLPISMYLLQVILDISKLQNVSLTTGETSLGWFIEILFVYLASFIFSIELLFSSKIAFKGRFFGEDLRRQTYKSLYTVGAPISILSLLLFVIQYTSSIFIILYFFAYFIMASIIFVLFLDIFEPISVLLFVKLINWWKMRKERARKVDYKNAYYMIFFGLAAFGLYFLINILLSMLIAPLLGITDANKQAKLYESGNFSNKNPTLINSLRFDSFIIFGISLLILSMVLLTVFMSYGLKYVKSVAVGFVIYLPIVIVLSILMSFSEEYWLTGQSSYITVFGFNYYTFRTASFKTSFFSEGNVSLLGYLAIPYLYTRYIFNVLVWGLLLYYIGRDFKIKIIPIDDKTVEKTIFSSVSEFIKYEDYTNEKIRFLVTKRSTGKPLSIEKEREEVQSLLRTLDVDKLLEELRPKQEDEKKRFYFTLKYLYTKSQIDIWKPEFSFIFDKIEKQGLYIIYNDGRDVFNFPFVEGGLQDPGLISGMFSAITSFIKETTKSKTVLRTIDHGDVTILIEYGTNVLSALFVKGTQFSEVRSQLRQFVDRFEQKHATVLTNWNGALAHFKQDELLVKEYFK